MLKVVETSVGEEFLNHKLAMKIDSYRQRGPSGPRQVNINFTYECSTSIRSYARKAYYIFALNFHIIFLGRPPKNLIAIPFT